MKYKVFNVYAYYDGPTVFTAEVTPGTVYLFRHYNDLRGRRCFMSDGDEYFCGEEEFDFSEARY